MPLYRPSELRNFLTSINKDPLRFSSQRFLIDGNVVSKIVAQVPTQYVLEIGSGPGVLTEALLISGHHVVAVEKDRDFAKALSRLPGHLTVIESDVLKCSLSDICPDEGLTVVSNLPYHLTTPILEWLMTKMPTKAVLMMQKEAALRLCSGKGGYIPILLSFFAHVHYGFLVSRNSFWPKPHVDSAVITLEKREGRLLSHNEEKPFFDMVKAIFAHKRKTVFHSLKEYGNIPDSLRDGLKMRPEDLVLEDFLRIFHQLYQI